MRIGAEAAAPVATLAGAPRSRNGCNDSNAGTQPEAPWRTLAKVNAISFQGDDTVHLRSGSLWREMIKPKRGGSAGHPVTFRAWAEGPRPIINGSDFVAGWTNEGGAVYRQRLEVFDRAPTRRRNECLADVFIDMRPEGYQREYPWWLGPHSAKGEDHAGGKPGGQDRDQAAQRQLEAACIRSSKIAWIARMRDDVSATFVPLPAMRRRTSFSSLMRVIVELQPSTRS